MFNVDENERDLLDIYIWMVNTPRVVTEKSRNWSITTTTTSSNRGKRRFDFASEASEDLRSKREGAKEQESPVSKSSLEKLTI